jgi:hypothetical protein
MTGSPLGTSPLDATLALAATHQADLRREAAADAMARLARGQHRTSIVSRTSLATLFAPARSALAATAPRSVLSPRTGEPCVTC